MKGRHNNRTLAHSMGFEWITDQPSAIKGAWPANRSRKVSVGLRSTIGPVMNRLRCSIPSSQHMAISSTCTSCGKKEGDRRLTVLTFMNFGACCGLSAGNSSSGFAGASCATNHHPQVHAAQLAKKKASSLPLYGSTCMPLLYYAKAHPGAGFEPMRPFLSKVNKLMESTHNRYKTIEGPPR